MRRKITLIAYSRLIAIIILAALISTLLAITLRVITEKTEDRSFELAKNNILLLLIFPAIGFTLIFFLRKFAFHNKANKGMKEIYNSIDNRRQELPLYKIPSHYINGFLTVIFGGSTGIEVSTVVATAAVGQSSFLKLRSANKYKTEIIAASVAAGITALFGSPIAGIFFAAEAIARKFSVSVLVAAALAVIVADGVLHLLGFQSGFQFHAKPWPYYAVPFILVFGMISGFVSVFFTKACLYIKHKFAEIDNNLFRIGLGALLVGAIIFIMPQLYGDTYRTVKNLFVNADHFQFSFTLILLLFTTVIVKPLVASITLGAGGDGGVFAPGLVMGAFLGLSFALIVNHFFGTHLIPVNFMLIGMAAVLSGCIHAPFTAVALLCTFCGGIIIIVPLIIGSFIAKYTAKYLYQYTVYSYKG